LATQQAGSAGIHPIGISRSPSAEPAALQQHYILTDDRHTDSGFESALPRARQAHRRPTQCQLTHFQLPRPRELHHLVFCVGEKDASFQVLLVCTPQELGALSPTDDTGDSSSHWRRHPACKRGAWRERGIWCGSSIALHACRSPSRTRPQHTLPTAQSVVPQMVRMFRRDMHACSKIKVDQGMARWCPATWE
jgi:hypothetical protein